MDEFVWVCLDRRITRQVLSIIKHLNELDILFFLSERTLIYKGFLYEDDLKIIIKNYLTAISDSKIFDFLNQIKFDFIDNLTKFMIQYKCINLIGKIVDEVKSHYLKTWTDWYTGNEYYHIKREDIRDFISSLEREIKLSLLI